MTIITIGSVLVLGIFIGYATSALKISKAIKKLPEEERKKFIDGMNNFF